jgi:hypothetical protein
MQDHYLEFKSLYTPNQSGFPHSRSTTDQFVCLESDIQYAKNEEAVFLDIEKAYDMLWTDGLLVQVRHHRKYVLIYCGLPKR